MLRDAFERGDRAARVPALDGARHGRRRQVAGSSTEFLDRLGETARDPARPLPPVRRRDHVLAARARSSRERRDRRRRRPEEAASSIPAGRRPGGRESRPARRRGLGLPSEPPAPGGDRSGRSAGSSRTLAAASRSSRLRRHPLGRADVPRPRRARRGLARDAPILLALPRAPRAARRAAGLGRGQLNATRGPARAARGGDARAADRAACSAASLDEPSARAIPTRPRATRSSSRRCSACSSTRARSAEANGGWRARR